MCSREKEESLCNNHLSTERGHKMVVLELILVSVLHFKAGFSVESTHLYYRPGHEAILPCASVSPSDTTCSIITWLYNRCRPQTIVEVKDGNVMKSSFRAARLSLDTNCSLVINNITAEDAGFYACRQGMDTNSDEHVYLSVLTISPDPPDADPKRDGNVTLECSLSRYIELGPCKENSLRWVDETGTVLLGKGVGYEVLRQTDCVTVLNVKRQSGHNRRYTCQFVNEDNTVKIEADYTPVFTDDNIYITIGAVVGVVVVLVIITAVLIKYRKRTKVTEDLQKTVQSLEPESNLTYISVSHHNQNASHKKKEEEENVTYSTVKTVTNTETENDPSHLYSCVSIQH